MVSKRKRLPGEERKIIILDTACNLFAEYGFDRTSTKQLAAAAKCSEALLYRYFDSKNAIMDALLNEWIEDQNTSAKLDIIDHSALLTLKRHYNSFLSQNEGPTPKAVHRSNLIKALNSNPYYKKKAYEAFLNSSDMIRDTIVPIIIFGQQQGEIKPYDAYTLANLFVGYMVGARTISNHFPDKYAPVPFEEFVHIFTDSTVKD